MEHVWFFEQWQGLQLRDVRQQLLSFSTELKPLGDMSVRDLCCLAKNDWIPVGLYVFTKGDRIIYAGKTHGRSFQERMLSHLDHRMPIPGSPHLAQLVQSISKKDNITAEEAVQKVMNMKIVWLPVPDLGRGKEYHKRLIATVERRLLWHKCLDPLYNSPRVKRNDHYSLKGERYQLEESFNLGREM